MDNHKDTVVVDKEQKTTVRFGPTGQQHQEVQSGPSGNRKYKVVLITKKQVCTKSWSLR